jgi:AcrR family transcriptional regulator
MPRPIDKKRPGELRDAIVQYLLQHRLAGLSLRPLAKALGCTPRVLLYHFGSKEGMIVEVLAHVRRQQRADYGATRAASFEAACWAIWKRMTSAGSEPHFRLFFEAYGIALRDPRRYRLFLDDTIEDWLQAIMQELAPAAEQSEDARCFATVVLAGLRGFLLDFCTTHDRKRLDRSVESWLQALRTIRLAPASGRGDR